jgi:hypothetical protein
MASYEYKRLLFLAVQPFEGSKSMLSHVLGSSLGFTVRDARANERRSPSPPSQVPAPIGKGVAQSSFLEANCHYGYDLSSLASSSKPTDQLRCSSAVIVH